MQNEIFENGLSQNEIKPDEIKEGISGIHVKDYRELGVNALEELILLDEQLDRNLKHIMDYITEGDYPKALTNLRWLIEDNKTHMDYCSKCQEEILYGMECAENSKHFEDFMNEPQ